MQNPGPQAPVGGQGYNYNQQQGYNHPLQQQFGQPQHNQNIPYQSSPVNVSHQGNRNYGNGGRPVIGNYHGMGNQGGLPQGGNYYGR